MENEDDLLNEILAAPRPPYETANRQLTAPAAAESQPYVSNNGVEFRQWVVGPNETFIPTGPTRKDLKPGVYEFDYSSDRGIFARKIDVVTDQLIPLPDTANERVLKGMTVFWANQAKYTIHGLLYKRGVLLYGPPGSGKTATLQLLSQQLLAMGGAVIICRAPEYTMLGLAALRRIEPKRPLICIFEDIDEITQRFGEHQILALLDGENQVSNIVNIATTNYPERLGARIVNRPSRFDERIFVGMPSAAARQIYLEKIIAKTGESAFQNFNLHQWVTDTEGLSIAHLRELSAAVLCLDQPYEAVIKRLRTMRHKITENAGQAASVGFGN